VVVVCVGASWEGGGGSEGTGVEEEGLVGSGRPGEAVPPPPPPPLAPPTADEPL